MREPKHFLSCSDDKVNRNTKYWPGDQNLLCVQGIPIKAADAGVAGYTTTADSSNWAHAKPALNLRILTSPVRSSSS